MSELTTGNNAVSPPNSEGRTCRICFSSQYEEPTSEMVDPCKCKGSMSSVHQKCLNAWIWSGQGSKKCDICHYPFKWCTGNMRPYNHCLALLYQDYMTTDPFFWIPELWALNSVALWYTVWRNGVTGCRRIWGDKWQIGLAVWSAEAFFLFIPAILSHRMYFKGLWTRFHTLKFAQYKDKD